MFNARHLVLAHFWVACVAFAAAVVLGEWQMVVRSPLALWLDDPGQYDRGVTAHGTVMAYVLPTLVAMGFGYALTELTLKRPLIGVRWGWAGFWLVIAGTLLVAATMGAEHASVLHTFYPPMIASPLYYLGILLVVAGSWVWVALMSVNLRAWKRAHRGQAVPLAMYGNVAGAYLWAWASLGAAVEVLVLILPASLGWTDTINAGLARVFFSWTLHAIVYFWLMPVYIACYTLVPRAIGGRLYSDAMGRVAFALFLVFSMPVGLHPWFAEAQHGAGGGLVRAAMTAMVSVPMALTVFALAASVGIAARLRGGRGPLGGLRALPWHEPMMLAVALAFVMLCFGAVGGLVHLGQPLQAAAHDPVLDTHWVTGPFHLIFGGAIVLMYFMIAYELWPQLTGCAPLPARAMRGQLWLWFGGMLVLATPWRWIDRLGTTPRLVYQDDSYAAIAPQAWTVVAAVFGGALLVASALLFLGILVRGRRGHVPPPVFRFALPAQACRPTPVLLNGFVFWVGMMVALTVVHYGGPIVQLSRLPTAAVPVVPVGSR